MQSFDEFMVEHKASLWGLRPMQPKEADANARRLNALQREEQKRLREARRIVREYVAEKSAPAPRKRQRVKGERLHLKLVEKRRPAWKDKPRSANVRASDVPDIEIFALDPCAYCGEPGQAHDHIDPVSRGGTNTYDNITRACHRCNLSKAATPLLKWLVRRAS
jgi:5-methylcytosine-specific restriction endonuclease McrA